MNWIGLSLVTLVSFSLMNILITYSVKKGVPVSFILLAIGIVFTVIYFLQTFISTKFSFEISLNILVILLIAGLLSVVGNWTMVSAMRDAPNSGLALAIAGLNAGVVALMATFLFKDKLTAMQIAGMVLGLIAIFLISLGSTGQK